MKTPEQELLDYWLMPQEQLKRHLSTVGRIAELRAELRVVEPAFIQGSVSALENGPPPEISEEKGTLKRISLDLPRRPPMRAPQQGSLRHAIHEVLSRKGKPVRRQEVIEAVAKVRGVAVTEPLRAKIGDALRNPHDPFIRKVSYGVYAFGGKGGE